MSKDARRNLDLEAALAEAVRAYVAAHPKSAAAHAAACAALPGGNTRTVLFFPPFPPTLASGEGAYVTDIDGHRTLDVLGEYTAGLYGHSHPVIADAVREALAGGIVLGGHTAREAAFAHALVERIPSLERVRFCNSGTEANLYALSAARAVSGREAVMVFEGAYHGGVFYYPPPPGRAPLNAPFPTIVAPYNDAEAACALIEANAARLAAVVVEPMQGSGGCIPATRAFLRALREATARHGVILVFDEVMTSRLAPGGLQEALDVIPDLTTLGKYLGGGLPFGAFGGRADIMDRFDPRRPDAFPHAGTFNNNVLTMAAGLAGLTEVYTPAAARRLNADGERVRAAVGKALSRLPACVTGCGSMMCVHFTPSPPHNAAEAGASPAAARALFHLSMLAHGVTIAPRGMMVLSLPMTDADHDALVAAVAATADEMAPLFE